MIWQPGLLSQRWDRHAQDWISWARTPNLDSYWRFHRDAFFELVPMAGRLTIDIGCGEGRVSRDLESRGHRVLGLDRSGAMCEAALTHEANMSPIVRADARQLPLPAQSADCAIAFMAPHDIDNMDVAVREVARTLVRGGSFVIAIVHPTYSGGGFMKSRTADSPFEVTRSYFRAEHRSPTTTRNDLSMTFHREHRPLKDYTHALADAGFVIEELNELTDPESAGNGIPMYLDILARQQSRWRLARPIFRSVRRALRWWRAELRAALPRTEGRPVWVDDYGRGQRVRPQHAEGVTGDGIGAVAW